MLKRTAAYAIFEAVPRLRPPTTRKESDSRCWVRCTVVGNEMVTMTETIVPEVKVGAQRNVLSLMCFLGGIPAGNAIRTLKAIIACL